MIGRQDLIKTKSSGLLASAPFFQIENRDEVCKAASLKGF